MYITHRCIDRVGGGSDTMVWKRGRRRNGGRRGSGEEATDATCQSHWSSDYCKMSRKAARQFIRAIRSVAKCHGRGVGVAGSQGRGGGHLQNVSSSTSRYTTQVYLWLINRERSSLPGAARAHICARTHSDTEGLRIRGQLLLKGGPDSPRLTSNLY